MQTFDKTVIVIVITVVICGWDLLLIFGGVRVGKVPRAVGKRQKELVATMWAHVGRGQAGGRVWER